MPCNIYIYIYITQLLWSPSCGLRLLWLHTDRFRIRLVRVSTNNLCRAERNTQMSPLAVSLNRISNINEVVSLPSQNSIILIRIPSRLRVPPPVSYTGASPHQVQITFPSQWLVTKTLSWGRDSTILCKINFRKRRILSIRGDTCSPSGYNTNEYSGSRQERSVIVCCVYQVVTW